MSRQTVQQLTHLLMGQVSQFSKKSLVAIVSGVAQWQSGAASVPGCRLQPGGARADLQVHRGEHARQG